MKKVSQCPESSSLRRESISFEVNSPTEESIKKTVEFAESQSKRSFGSESIEIDQIQVLPASKWKVLKEDSSFSDLLTTKYGKSDLSTVLRRCVQMGDPTILTYVGDQSEGRGTLFPLLNPGELRRFSDQTRLNEFEEVSKDSSYHLTFGPTALMTESKVSNRVYGAQEGLVSDVRLASGKVMTNTLQMTSNEGDDKITEINQVDVNGEDNGYTALFNVADYPRLSRANENALIFAFKGKNITPAFISRMADQAGIDAFGFHIIARSTEKGANFRAIHHLPSKTIEVGELVDTDKKEYMNKIQGGGITLSSGTRSSKEEYSRWGHAHTASVDRENPTGGHLDSLDGEVIVVILPAKKEIISEYS